jgi:hypothetical protein
LISIGTGVVADDHEIVFMYGAAVLRVAAADIASEVFRGEFERGKRRVLPDLARDDLIDRFAAVNVLGERLLRDGVRSATPTRRRVSVERSHNSDTTVT